MSEEVHTQFCFELVGRIVVADENRNLAQELNFDVNLVVAYGTDKCIVSPDVSNLLITYNINGTVLKRAYLAVDVVDFTMGGKGYPLLIGNGTNSVFEYRYYDLKRPLKRGTCYLLHLLL